MANLAGFFFNKVRKNDFLSVVLYKDSKYYIAISDLVVQGNLEGKLIISLFPKTELTAGNIQRMEEHVIAEIEGDKLSIFSRTYKPIFLRWTKEFQEETNQETKLI